MNIIVAVTGASGAIYGLKVLELLQKHKISTHLIISKAAAITIKEELEKDVSYFESLATKIYKVQNIAADIASGSFKTNGMIIAPCSVKTMSEIACGISSNLISRAADVCIKEQRKLALMVRETPLNVMHLSNMLKLSQAGALIAPPVPAFYNHPESIDDMVTHSVCRVLDHFNIETAAIKRWKGL
jgi:4-hydroxy-3-polyprenylbenzoate decarboxylase